MGNYDITSGKIPHAKKVLIYGPEGVGKSTFSSKFPDPLFIDTEGSTRNLDVKRFPSPTSWPMLLDEISSVLQNKPCKTLVIDTLDWAEKICIKDLCATKGWSGIEDPGYGKGYTYLVERFGTLLNLLEDVVRNGINVVVTAHAKINKFEQPDEMGAYDRWELKLEKKDASISKEWADMILFANYKTIVIKDENGKKKGQGGQKRVMYTTHTAAWDAKNRDDLPDVLDFDFKQIAYLFANNQSVQSAQSVQPVEHPQPQVINTEQPQTLDAVEQQPEVPTNVTSNDSEIPQALLDLMQQNNVTEEDIQQVVAEKGYFPKDMPISMYPKEFTEGVLIGSWLQVLDSIMRFKLPF